MSEPTITYYLDKLGLGNESNDIEIDHEALHGKEVSPQIATLLLLQQIERHLKDISIVVHEINEKS